jgi:hypothetical protein
MGEAMGSIAFVECPCGACGPVRRASEDAKAREYAVSAWNRAHGSYDRSVPDFRDPLVDP